MSRVDICYVTFCLTDQTVAPTLPGVQSIKCCLQYLDSHPHKSITYPYNSYDESNVIRLIWSGIQVANHTTQNFLEFCQDADHAIIINRRRSVSDIIHTFLGVDVCWKVYIQPYIAYYSAYG